MPELAVRITRPATELKSQRTVAAAHEAGVAVAESRCPGVASLPSIAFVMPGIGAGGSENVVTLLCNHFARLGARVQLICFEPPGERPFYPLAPGVALACLGGGAHPRSPLARAWAAYRRYRILRRELGQLRPGIVISFLTRTNVLAALAGNSLGIPVVVSERNNPQRQPVGPVWDRLRHHAYDRAAALVTMTSGAGRCFPPAPQRVDRVIPNHARMPLRPAAFDPAGVRLVAVGRLVEQKGFDLLLEAFARIAPDFPEWNLTIWGEGPMRGSLEAQRAALKLDGRVALPGITQRPGDWVTDTDLFVLSSRFEGWGLVVGEAMAAGIATVAFDCPFGPGDMIEDGRTGLLAPDQDVAGLAAALARVMADPVLRQRLATAGRKAMEVYAPDRIVRQWEELVHLVAGRTEHSVNGRPS